VTYRTLDAIEALELAIAMLESIGVPPTLSGFFQALKDSRDAHRGSSRSVSSNRKPQTALPWRVTGKWGGSVGGTAVEVGERPEQTLWLNHADDAAYIVHAANAYPQLIEHYRDALSLLEGWIAHRCPAKYRAEHQADLERKRALLFDLGEAA
jgi:hypothetical protein